MSPSVNLIQLVFESLPWLVNIVSAGLALVFALRWPSVRGKHLLCVTLSIGVASSTLSLLFFLAVRTDTFSFDSPLMAVTQFVLQGTSIVYSVAFVAFVAVLGSELRRREAEHADSW